VQDKRFGVDVGLAGSRHRCCCFFCSVAQPTKKKMRSPTSKRKKRVAIVHCSRGGFGAGVAKTVGDRLRSRGCCVRVVSARDDANEKTWADQPDVVVAISPIYFRMLPRNFKQFFRQHAFDHPSPAPRVVPLITAGRPTNGAPRRRLGRFFDAHGWKTLHPGFDLAAMAPVSPSESSERIDEIVDVITTE